MGLIVLERLRFELQLDRIDSLECRVRRANEGCFRDGNATREVSRCLTASLGHLTARFKPHNN